MSLALYTDVHFAYHNIPSFVQVNIVLKETETIWILDIPGTCVALDSDEAELVKTKNEAYKEVHCACVVHKYK